MKNEKYQGFENPQTWCVALTLDNEKETKDAAKDCLKITKDWSRPELDAESVQENELHKFIMSDKITLKIMAMAPWAWEGLSVPANVNFKEIREHLSAE